MRESQTRRHEEDALNIIESLILSRRGFLKLTAISASTFAVPPLV
ncbi:MAG: twin-arginine translocation signal domain-containing protein, partial [Luteibacter sp.]